ncbi:hypothetical protein BD779DRAFT_1659128 [Infundibulicybe gibba]|nr:hypothetical protein BD779DRAFT_1659128 [Infundibulicybe gibba]
MDVAEENIPRDLFELLRGFSSLTPPNRLCFPANISPVLVHDFLINFILLNSHIRDYPPSREYQKNFWKWAITHLESIEEFEIDSRIYDYYVELMPHSGPYVSHVLSMLPVPTYTSALGPPQPHMFGRTCDLGLPLRAPPSPSYVTHFWNLEGDPHMTQESESVDMARLKTTTLFESRTTIESGTTGLRTWRAGFLLAQYLILRPELVQGKRVLELGSGAGFLGITVASLQTFSALNSSLWMTDVNGTVLQRCRENIGLPCNLSSAHPRVQCVHLDWAISLDPELSPNYGHGWMEI